MMIIKTNFHPRGILRRQTIDDVVGGRICEWGLLVPWWWSTSAEKAAAPFWDVRASPIGIVWTRQEQLLFQPATNSYSMGTVPYY